MKALFLIFGFVALLALSDGCSTVSKNSLRTTEPTKLGVLIGNADRIVVTAPGDFVSVTISGASAEAITKDVSYMPLSGPCFADTFFSYELRFFRGKTSLATIVLGVNTFMYEGDEHRGDTGILEALSRSMDNLGSALYRIGHTPKVGAANSR